MVLVAKSFFNFLCLFFLQSQEFKGTPEKCRFWCLLESIYDFWFELRQVWIVYEIVFAIAFFGWADYEVPACTATDAKREYFGLTILSTILIDQIYDSKSITNGTVCQEKYTFLNILRDLVRKNALQRFSNYGSAQIRVKPCNLFFGMLQIFIIIRYQRCWLAHNFIHKIHTRQGQILVITSKADNLELAPLRQALHEKFKSFLGRLNPWATHGSTSVNYKVKGCLLLGVYFVYFTFIQFFHVILVLDCVGVLLWEHVLRLSWFESRKELRHDCNISRILRLTFLIVKSWFIHIDSFEIDVQVFL